MENSTQKEWTNLFKGYFVKYIIWGVILILLSFIIEFTFIPLLNGGHKFIHFALSFLNFLFSTVGIALIIASIFTYSIETANFIDYVKKLLMKIVVTKDFLKTLNQIDKKDALKRILTPSNEQLIVYSNIAEYFDEYISKSLSLFDTNFKTHLSLVIKAYHENSHVVLEETFNYRVYKIKENYEPLIIGFATLKEEFVDAELISQTGKSIKLKKSDFEIKENEESGFKWMEYKYPLNDYFKDSKYVNISFTSKELGNDHWAAFGFKNTYPTDGVSLDLRCNDDLVIKDHIIYDNDKKYSQNISADKKELKINSPQWIDKGSGIHILIGKK